MRIKLKAIGGPRPDEWNTLLAKQEIRALRMNDVGPEERDGSRAPPSPRWLASRRRTIRKA